jgi:maleate isomerase
MTAFDAILVALQELSARRIILLTPYPAEVTVTEAAMFSADGVAVAAWACLGLDDGYGLITHRQVKELISSVSHAAIEEADAIVLSCTGWPTFDLIPGLRQSLGMPVISSNLAIGMHALRENDDAS